MIMVGKSPKERARGRAARTYDKLDGLMVELREKGVHPDDIASHPRYKQLAKKLEERKREFRPG